MAYQPKLIHQSPNFENTIGFKQYQASSPEKFSLHDDDKFVLYAGGSHFQIQYLENPNLTITVHDSILPMFHHPVDVFVLNSLLILWCEATNYGIEFPYQSILLHALQLPNTLYLQISSSQLFTAKFITPSEFVPTVELTLSPTQHPQTNQLLKTVPNSLEAIYHAMSKCSAFHAEEPEQDIDTSFTSDNDVEVPQDWIREIGINNQGNADDLDDQTDSEDETQETEAGMNVDVGYGPVAGVTRKRDEEDRGKKSRKI